MSAAIEIADVSKVYDGGVRAVDAVAMKIKAGEFFSLLGPSGCGKTTTLRMIAGFDTPSIGEIRVDGTDITHVPAHKRDMAMVFQNYALFPHRTVAENVAFGLRMRKIDKATIAAKVKAALAMVELSGMENRRPAQLSGGQQQRVAIARALMGQPDVIFADEPTGALDTRSGRAVLGLLRDAVDQDGRSLVMVTHDPNAAAWADETIFLADGRIVGSLERPAAEEIAERLSAMGA
jgi:putative spermidine/putrescine transport system ATP-binding protein